MEHVLASTRRTLCGAPGMVTYAKRPSFCSAVVTTSPTGEPDRDHRHAGTANPPRVRVAWLQPVVAHYRVPVINRLYESNLIDLTVYAGQELDGVGVADASSQLQRPHVGFRNLRLSRRDARVLYVMGWTRMAASRPAIVITTEATHNVVNWALLAMRRVWKYKVIIMGHIRSSGQGPLATTLRRRLVTGADGVLAYTSAGAKQAASWGVPLERVAALGNTLDLSRIDDARRSARPNDVALLRDTLGLEGTICLFIGRPHHAKRLDVAIDAMRLLGDENIPAHLIIIGTSRELPTYVERAQGMSNVHFIGEVLDEAVLARYFALTDLVLIPGAVGLSVNHAFAYGVPILTSADAPHGPEMAIAIHGQNALIAEAMQANLFADAIAELARNRETVVRLKAGAATTVLPAIDNMVKAIESLSIAVERAH